MNGNDVNDREGQNIGERDRNNKNVEQKDAWIARTKRDSE